MKEYWFIDIRYPKVEPKKDINLSNSMRKRLKEIGNYFETKEEAEKAVEKLKALKSLKDKGFKITGWGFRDDEVGIFIRANCPSNTVDELELLFGGEDE